MKKSLVAVSVIVVLGAAWTGASWYTGKLIEQRMGEMVDNANSQLKVYLPDAGIKLSYENYQRGIFSSHLRYVLRSDGTIKTDGGLLKAGEEVALLETVDHGPFPLAQLKRFNLIPSLASVHTELENTPPVKALFKITKGQSLFTADSRITYSGDTSSAIDVIPVELQKDQTSLKFSGATLNADVGRDLKTIVLNGNSDSTIISGPGQSGLTEQVTLQGLTLNSNTHKGQFDLSLGDQKLGLKQLKVAVDGKEVLTMDGVNLASQFGEKDTKLNGQFDYTLDAVKIQGNDFGSGKLLLKIDNLDGKWLKEFATRYNQEAMALLQQSATLDPQAYQQQTSEMLIKNLPLLLKGNPSISIAPLSWKNSKGESTFTLNLDLTDPTQADSTAVSPDQLLAQSVKKLEAALVIPVAMATETTAQAAKLQGYSAEEAQKMAQQQIQSLAAMGQMFKLTTLKDDVIGSSFHYADNQVELNGNKMSLQEFVGLFGMMGGSPAAPAQDAEPAQPSLDK
ncbi:MULTISPECIES: YdgA family protein [unclassified Serratia (in: enterobacteria)]|uniref:YdgA family protein n=1 Tax=unclassified Serratia (in: enterobacteria) TaxID=2647522 RepID=UPI0005037DE6|nr:MULTISPECIES: YdgA family protein [unclassified Serratia (in: enterobacteria)]KFK94685.1 GTP-binding protein YdgA [Serratia sp. Ag2]KFK99155.1 GTP-binding protein YdgA [Serratia sp. Ag1]